MATIGSPRTFLKTFRFLVRVPGVKRDGVMRLKWRHEGKKVFLELKRGVSFPMDLDWAYLGEELGRRLNGIRVDLMDRSGAITAKWNVDATVASYSPGDLNSMRNDTLLETLRLEVQGVTLEKGDQPEAFDEKDVRLPSW
jgi:hypothetical protein